MKRYFASILTVLLLTSMASSAFAADQVRGNIGIGVGRGTFGHLGLSAKFYTGESFALQPVLGVWSNSIGLSVDALYEMPAIAKVGPLEIAWNLGVGPGIGLGDDYLGVAVSGVAGLEFNFNAIPGLPFDIVVEYRPTLSVLPSVNLDLVDFTGHLRIYF